VLSALCADGTFATTGSDGTFNFWDKEQRQRLKAFTPRRPPIPCGQFSRDGQIFAYAVSCASPPPV
jgi:mRNA export factor